MDPLRISAFSEAATGVALILMPRLVVGLLLGQDASVSGVATARIGGLALLAMGIACWPVAGANGTRAGTALLVYNVPATIYLGMLAIDGELRGPLLWPAVVVHVVVTAALVVSMRRRNS